jgi:hypothetical protein
VSNYRSSTIWDLNKKNHQRTKETITDLNTLSEY